MLVDSSKYFHTNYKFHLGLLKIQKIDRKYLHIEDNLNLKLCGSRKRLPNYYYYKSMLYEQFKTIMTLCSLTGIEACQFNQCDLFFEDSWHCNGDGLDGYTS